MIASVYHGGSRSRRKYSVSGGGGGGGVEYVSLQYENKDTNLVVGDPIQAPGYNISFSPWNQPEQGYYFGANYNLKAARILFNDLDSIGTNTVTVAIKRKLADGTDPAGVSLATMLLNIPNLGFNALFLGFYIDLWTIEITAGNFVYGEIVQRSGGTYNGINMSLLFEKA